MHLKVYRKAQRWHTKGRYYAMHMDTPDGDLLVADASDPEHAAARALVALGHTGPFEVWIPSASEQGKWIVSLRIKSAREAAKFSMVEEDRRGLKLVRYRPGPKGRARSGAAEGVSVASVGDLGEGGGRRPEPECFAANVRGGI